MGMLCLASKVPKRVLLNEFGKSFVDWSVSGATRAAGPLFERSEWPVSFVPVSLQRQFRYEAGSTLAVTSCEW
jgi:hypothetical protein